MELQAIYVSDEDASDEESLTNFHGARKEKERRVAHLLPVILFIIVTTITNNCFKDLLSRYDS